MIDKNLSTALLNCMAKMAYEIKSMSLHREQGSWKKIQTLSDNIAFFADEIRLDRKIDEKTALKLTKEVAPYAKHSYESIFTDSIKNEQQSACAS